jgi:hypothetical protein
MILWRQIQNFCHKRIKPKSQSQRTTIKPTTSVTSATAAAVDVTADSGISEPVVPVQAGRALWACHGDDEPVVARTAGPAPICSVVGRIIISAWIITGSIHIIAGTCTAPLSKTSSSAGFLLLMGTDISSKAIG